MQEDNIKTIDDIIHKILDCIEIIPFAEVNYENLNDYYNRSIDPVEQSELLSRMNDDKNAQEEAINQFRLNFRLFIDLVGKTESIEKYKYVIELIRKADEEGLYFSYRLGDCDDYLIKNIDDSCKKILEIIFKKSILCLKYYYCVREQNNNSEDEMLKLLLTTLNNDGERLIIESADTYWNEIVELKKDLKKGIDQLILYVRLLVDLVGKTKFIEEYVDVYKMIRPVEWALSNQTGSDLDSILNYPYADEANENKDD
ncbi:MAG: hypothetical protein HQK77_18320 [Desulfobacterales bacterium]|nr:hypothetical protein [Desulfobacterales bacterium]